MGAPNLTPSNEYYAPDWQRHIMGPSSGQKAFVQFEDEQHEVIAVDGALRALVAAKIISDSHYDLQAFAKFSASVESNFEIPWTGISPRMRRMIYAINALKRPCSVVCAGIFCGYTFICNAGTSIGAGACYTADRLVGIELLPLEAARAATNIERFAEGEGKTVVCADAAAWFATTCQFNVDLLYIDAKAIEFDPKFQPSTPILEQSEYFKIVQAAMCHLNSGALVLAHNSVNASKSIRDYLEFVRSDAFRASMNLFIDDAGLEVSLY